MQLAFQLRYEPRIGHYITQINCFLFASWKLFDDNTNINISTVKHHYGFMKHYKDKLWGIMEGQYLDSSSFCKNFVSLSLSYYDFHNLSIFYNSFLFSSNKQGTFVHITIKICEANILFETSNPQSFTFINSCWIHISYSLFAPFLWWLSGEFFIIQPAQKYP